MALRFVALMAMFVGTPAPPSRVACDRAMEVGVSLMFNTAVSTANDEFGVTFAGKECGGTYTPGEEVNVVFTPGVVEGRYLLRVEGAEFTQATMDAINADGDETALTPECESTQMYENGIVSGGNGFEGISISTTASTGDISVFTGHASGFVAVAVSPRCTLSAAVEEPSPPPSATPPTSSPLPPSASPSPPALSPPAGSPNLSPSPVLSPPAGSPNMSPPAPPSPVPDPCIRRRRLLFASIC